MGFSKAKMARSNNRKKPYGLILMLALGTVTMCAVVLHKLREGRILGLLLQEREQQLVTLQILLQKEKDNTKDMKRKLDDMKAKTFALRNQKMELTDKLVETQYTEARLEKMQTELEAALEEKQNQIDKLTEKTEKFIVTNLQVTNLASLLNQKEAEVEELKRSLIKQDLVENNTNGDNIARMNASAVNNIRENTATQNENPQLDSFSTSEERRANREQHHELPQKGEWVKFQTNMEEADLKAKNVSSTNQQAAEVSENKEKPKYPEKTKIFSTEVEEIQEGEVDAKPTEETFGTTEMKETQDGEINAKPTEESLGTTEVKEIQDGEVDAKLTEETLGTTAVKETKDGEVDAKHTEKRLDTTEVKETQEGKVAGNPTEEMDIPMKENYSNSTDRVDHENVEETKVQQKAPEGPELAAKTEFKERRRRHKRRRVRQKMVQSTELKGHAEMQSNKSQENEMISRNAENGMANDEKMVGTSSDKRKYISEEKIQVAEGITSSSTDNKSTSQTNSRDSEFSSTEKEMGGNALVNDSTGNKNQEAKNDKPEEDQGGTNNESPKIEGQSNSSKDLQFQESKNSEVRQSSQDNGILFTETTNKEAGKETESIGQSETSENPEDSETKRKTSDEKEGKSEGKSEKPENLDDEQNLFPEDPTETA